MDENELINRIADELKDLVRELEAGQQPSNISLYEAISANVRRQMQIERRRAREPIY